MNRAWLYPAPPESDVEVLIAAALRLWGVPEEHLERATIAVAESVDCYIYVPRVRSADGERLWLYCSPADVPAEDGGGAGLVIECADGSFCQPLRMLQNPPRVPLACHPLEGTGRLGDPRLPGQLPSAAAA